jgi:Tfp pilus assembly protein PilE
MSCSRRTIHSRASPGFTLIENLFAVAIVAFFFGALYALNSQCLYLLNSGREATSAEQAMQDRMEQLRNAHWSQVTSASYIQSSILNSPSNSAAFLSKTTETITVNSYPTAANPPIQVQRLNGVATIVSNNAAIANGDMVRIDIALNWTASPGNRARSQVISTIWGENTR